MPRYFEYGDDAIEYLKSRDKKLAAAMDAVGHVYREMEEGMVLLYHEVPKRVICMQRLKYLYSIDCAPQTAHLDAQLRAERREDVGLAIAQWLFTRASRLSAQFGGRVLGLKAARVLECYNSWLRKRQRIMPPNWAARV